MGVKMRVAYGNPDNVDMDSDTFANSLFRWVAKHLPQRSQMQEYGSQVSPESREILLFRRCAGRRG